jgi:hypothetical protein
MKTPKYFDIFEHLVPSKDYFGAPLAIHGPHELIPDHLIRYNVLRVYNIKLLVTPKVINYDDTLEEMKIKE